MLALRLRDEFRGNRLKGTAIELANEAKTGATQVEAQAFLEITYPTHDVLKAIEAVGPDQGRPIVIIGERGLGKSHLLAALYHAMTAPDSMRAWLDSWAGILNQPRIASVALRDKMRVIGESLHRHRYKFLWDLLFDRHPNGAYIRGKWEGLGDAKTDVPSDQLILELLRHTPVMLLLDEFQTWYDGLTNTKQYPWKHWAFNFIQMLSEIAKEHPELLVLVVSVRNGTTDAYQQIHRVNPTQIDFKAGGSPERIQQDRRRMLLHRLFENRLQIAHDDIEGLIAPHVAEYFRLLDVAASEQARKRKEFVDTWPFAPHLLQLLEDQVLVATDAQETRDLIRILANLYKSQGHTTPILTAANFRLENDEAGIGALLDSVANQWHRTLRDKAQRNLIAVTEAVPDHAATVPHLNELVSALWLRSIAVGNLAGAEPAMLQVDITRAKPVDDNAFQVELAAIVENSFNIHQSGSRLVFREEENPQAKLMSYARNDKLFVDGSDLAQLGKQIRYVIGGSEGVTRVSRVMALPKSWRSDPWTQLDESERPERWDERLPILVLPEEPDSLNEGLGHWLKSHLDKRRNTIRFLIPRSGAVSVYQDRDLILLARAELKALEWSSQNPDYRRLHTKYQGELRDLLKKRFDRFAVLNRWDYANPARCEFQIESLRAHGSQIPETIETVLTSDLFVPEDFENVVAEYAAANSSLGKFLNELKEPRPNGQECIPWLGETAMKEHILRLCARSRITLEVRGTEFLQAQPGEDEDTAWKRLRSKLPHTGRQLEEILLLLPSAVPAVGGTMVVAGGSETNTGVKEPPPTPQPGGGTAPPSGVGSGFPFGGSLFGTSPRENFHNPATSPINLIGKLESWGVGAATPVKEINLRLSSATGAQLKELLKKLPDGMTFELSLEKE